MGQGYVVGVADVEAEDWFRSWSWNVPAGAGIAVQHGAGRLGLHSLGVRPNARPMPFTESDGLRIYFESFGAGKPIVLVHGWGSDLRHNWIATGWLDALRAIRRVVALDCRGHGKSDKPREQAAYSYRAMSRDALRVMDQLAIERADFLGYSMGACIGACLIGEAPQRFSAMVLGGIGDETPESEGACRAIAAGLRAPRAEDVADPIGRAYRAFAAANPHNDLEALALSALQLWPEGYPLELAGPRHSEVDLPLLVVNGAEDRPYVLSDERFVAAIPGARLVRIPARDHLSVVPDPRFKAAVIEFLEQRDRA
jgi:pimeloyl-ACP methyl ester carboxylesterase